MRIATNHPSQAAVLPSPTVPELLQALEHKDHIIEEQQKLIRLMEEKLRLAQIRRFGASSEKLPMSGDLFDEAELEAALGDLEGQLPPDTDLQVVRKPRKPATPRIQ